MQFYDFKEIEERVILIGVQTEQDEDVAATLDELEELAATAGAVTVGKVIQNREAVHPGTYIGKGKIEEVAALLAAYDANGVICDDELSPAQMSNLEEALEVKVMDRTLLILDIFAQRARSKEGKLQVELAQLKYMLPRLTGKGIEMSRLGGGIGTRGPGETKLETDKRHIRRRMETLKDELAEVEKHRQMLRKRRKKDGVVTCAIVGYTNAGKSTLMNYLTNAGVLAQDKLFATLDPTSRALKLPSGVTIMLIDTVGLVRRLPHHLVEAFRSTLEEAAQSDIIINLCDASSDEARTHLQVTKDLLESLNCGDTPIINVLNKCDLIADDTIEQDFGSYVKISAKTGEGIEKLLEEIDNNLPLRLKKVNVLIPFANAGLANEIRNKGTLLSEEYESDGIKIEAIVDEQTYAKIGNFEV